jgi:5-methyltetrahydropteroyltriglutamate--homocysteine methyltransferase
MQLAARLIGYPRVGPNGELNFALEHARIAELRDAHLAEQRDLVGSAVDDYFLYDAVLETALMFGIVPDWAGAAHLRRDPFAVLTAVARGTPEHEAWETAKWFDTNDQYVVPEISGSVSRFVPLPWREPKREAGTTWSIIGPYSLARLSHLADGLEVENVAGHLGDALWAWVRRQQARDAEFSLQLDEPCLGMAMSPTDEATLATAYSGAADLVKVQVPLVTVQFGQPSEESIHELSRHGFAVQLPLSMATSAVAAAQPELAVSVLDGRSLSPDEFRPVRDALSSLVDDGRRIWLLPTTSLTFLPQAIEGEELPAGRQFAREKAGTLAAWADALANGTDPASTGASRS